MRTAVLAAFLVSAAVLSPPAAASVEDACDNLGVCVLLHDIVEATCLQLGFNDEVCSGDPCGMVFSAATCTSLRASLYALCTGLRPLDEATCALVSETPT